MSDIKEMAAAAAVFELVAQGVQNLADNLEINNFKEGYKIHKLTDVNVDGTEEDDALQIVRERIEAFAALLFKDADGFAEDAKCYIRALENASENYEEA